MANRLLTEYSINPAKLYDLSAVRATGTNTNPVHWVQTMFNAGRWLNTYELPFFKNSYLESNQYTNWATGGLSQIVGTRRQR